jgi:CheY-like chemotaxis protein
VTRVPDDVRARWRPRTEAELVAQQVLGLNAWHATRRVREEAASVSATSRDMRLELARRLDVLRRTHEAVLERTAQQLRESTRLLRTEVPCRAVIAHRNDWFRGKLAAGLADQRIAVVAQVDNGADAVGVTVAEQPDLLFVEDSLPMIVGEEVIREVRRLAPVTIAAAQVGYEERLPALLDAGAAAVFRRHVPPAEVSADLGQLLQRAPA